MLLIVKDLLEKLNLRESLVVLEAEAGMEVSLPCSMISSVLTVVLQFS